MKPNFALGLTKDGITLWQRGASGWLRVGAVSPESQQMDAQMRDLAKIAASLAPEGVQTKLVVPDDQILFCDVDVTAKNPDMQAHEIRAQLAGRTPYPVEELDFDWTVSGGTAHVAVVARETVIEAEDFANLYGLNPVSVVGAAESGRFTQEPFFGTTRNARAILGDPTLLERDRDILRETGIATLPDPELVEQTPTPKPSQTVEVAPAADTVSDNAPSKTAAASDTKTKPEKRDQAQKASAEAPKPNAPAAKAEPAKAKAAEPQPETALSGIKAPAIAAPKPDSDATDGAAVAFRSRRAAVTTRDTAPAKTPGAKAPTRSGKDLLGSLRTRLTSGQGLSKLAFGSLGKSLGGPKPSVSEKAAPSDTAPKPAVAEAKPDLPAKAPATGRPKSSGRAAPATGKNKPAPTRPVKEMLPRRKDPLDTLSARAGSDGSQTEVERMTIFGARNRDEPEANPARRALLVLAGVGMLLLAVAIWVFYMTVTGPEPAPELAEDLNPVIEPAPLDPELTAPLDDAPLQDEIEAALGLEDAAQQLPIDATGPELAQDAQAATDPSPPLSGNDVNAGRIAGLRSSSLLPPQETVPLPEAPSAPAPFGTEPLPPLREDLATAALSAEDAIPAEPGDLAPDDTPVQPETGLPAGEEALEIAVTEGTPPVTPPVRPEGLAPELEAAAVPDPDPVPQPEPETAVVPDSPPAPVDESSLVINVTEGSPAVTPPERPAGLAPDLPETEPAPEPASSPDPEGETTPDQPEDNASADQAGLNTPPPGGVALTALRPATRPDTLAEAVATAAAAPELDASDLAVAASLRPGARPGQFSAVVQRTLRAAQARTHAQAPASTAAPEAAIQTARAAVQPAPPIPASASVAREATQARAINLRQINLIGVMGTSSSRRALVRLSNGRVVAVRVGESLDGGQVTAIGENELRYNRRGRDVVLRIAS